VAQRYFKAFAAQELIEQLAQFDIVIDEQDSHGNTLPWRHASYGEDLQRGLYKSLQCRQTGLKGGA
jgi:hypothetical protein